MGLLFYPRGGSAQVARYLAAALDRKGWPVRLFTGSLGEPGAVANAATFFAGLDVVAADFTPALEAFARGDALIEVETDKATVIYDAEWDGMLAAILVPEGGTAGVGEAIATLSNGCFGLV